MRIQLGDYDDESIITPRIRLTTLESDVFNYMLLFFVANDQLPSIGYINKGLGKKGVGNVQRALKGLYNKGAIEKNDAGNWRFVDPYRGNKEMEAARLMALMI